MKERSILFNGEMVKAILDGRKTQTRRVIKPQPNCQLVHGCGDIWDEDNLTRKLFYCKYGQPGDRLWVRETASVSVWQPASREIELTYLADGNTWQGVLPERLKWKPKCGVGVPNGIFKEAARIFLKITAVRVERVQDISEEDVKAEGAKDLYEGLSYHPPGYPINCQENFLALWNSIYEKRSYGVDVNPWVWVYEFKKV